MSVQRTAFWLAAVTVVYNLAEGAFSVLFAHRDSSVALLGFGADSFIESLSGGVMLWRFWGEHGAEKREQLAARLVGISFIILAAYVGYESIETLTGESQPERSLPALVIAGLSLLVMPTLFLLKRRTARRLASKSLLADSKQTLACMMLSVALLAGAGLNYWLAWWKADAVAGLLIALYLVREGYEALTTREICNC